MEKKKKEPAGALAARTVAIMTVPGDSGYPVSVVNAGTYLLIAKDDGDWIEVLFGNVQGWVPADAIRS